MLPTPMCSYLMDAILPCNDQYLMQDIVIHEFGPIAVLLLSRLESVQGLLSPWKEASGIKNLVVGL